VRNHPRVVLVSTMVVYGAGIEGVLDETARWRPSGVAYADAKIEAEALAFEHALRGDVAVSVVQPTAVYGPYAPSWTVKVLAALRTRRVVLVDGGVGYANPVYVDDVVDAMLAAATHDAAVGEAFLVSSDEVVTWKEFYGRYEAMLGTTSTVSMSLAETKAHYERTHRRRGAIRELYALLREQPSMRARLAATREGSLLHPLLRRLATHPHLRAALPRPPSPRALDLTPAGRRLLKPIEAVHPRHAEFLAAKTEVRIDKARRLLGYRPRFDLARGMALTEAWARWARLVGDRRRSAA
jgi:nucleoside-diphosphate-sugar epimerase